MERRFLLSLVVSGATALTVGRPGNAWAADTTQTERSVGKPDAKHTVIEFFSLTCTHCAAFARTTMPQIKEQYVDTGKVRIVYHDFPLDQIALTAAMVARHLPEDRYEPFINALLSSQDRWVFARGVDPIAELWKTAALAGMNRATFDKAIVDDTLRTFLLKQQQDDTARWKIDATPSFVINGQRHSGGLSFDAFRKLIPDS